MNRRLKFILPVFLLYTCHLYSQPCLTPSVGIVLTPTGMLCANDILKFTATASNTGPLPTINYSFKVNGFIVQNGSSDFFISSSLVTGDVVICDITVSGTACFITNTASSNAITVSLTALLTPVASLTVTNQGSTCAGAPRTFHINAFATGGGQVNYTFYVNNAPLQSGASLDFTTSSLVNGDIVYGEIQITGGTCLATNTATTPLLTIAWPAPFTPSTIILAGSTQICQGTPVVFTAVNFIGFNGALVVFQWNINNQFASNSPVFITSNLQNGDAVSLTITVTGGCYTTNTATSNIITIQVNNSSLFPSVSISPITNPLCEGENVTIKATPINGGPAPSYQWKLNGQNAGSDSIAFSSSSFHTGDVISCVMTSNATCISSNPAVSNNINLIMQSFCPDGIFVPSAFTPNDDGNNDVLRPLTFRPFVKYKFTVYNRWGQKIFETQDPQKSWDGRWKGIALTTETFVWYCTYQFSGKAEEKRKGTVTLIK